MQGTWLALISGIIIGLSLTKTALSFYKLKSNVLCFPKETSRYALKKEKIVFKPVSRKGFFLYRKKQVEEKQEGTVSETLQNFSLKGTIICSECKESIAFIEVPSKQVVSVRVGEEVEGYLVKSISESEVILEKNGKTFVLTSEEKEENGVNVKETETKRLKREEILEEISSGKFLRYINILPVEGGLKVLYVRRNSFIYEMGIRPGDIIEAVNGIPLKTPEDAFSAFEKLKSSEVIVLTLKRRGREIELRYELD